MGIPLLNGTIRLRKQLKILKNLINSSISKTSNSMNKIHLRDAVERINMILDPK